MMTPSAEKCCWEMWWTCPIWIPKVWALERPVGRCIWPIPHAQLEPGGVSSGDRLRFRGVSPSIRLPSKLHNASKKSTEDIKSANILLDRLAAEWTVKGDYQYPLSISTKNIQLMYPYTINIYIYQYLSVNPVNPVDVSVFHVFPCFIHYILYPQKISSWSFCIPCFQSELGGVFKKKAQGMVQQRWPTLVWASPRKLEMPRAARLRQPLFGERYSAFWTLELHKSWSIHTRWL